MVPAGEADFLVVLAADQVEVNRHSFAQGGVLDPAGPHRRGEPANRRSLNVAAASVAHRRSTQADGSSIHALPRSCTRRTASLPPQTALAEQ